jgi:DNA polymerase-3 subunit delta
MAGWVLKKAVEEKGEFTPQAAAALAEHIGNDTRTATLEIQKLLAYVNYARTITREDVELLSARIDDPDIFGMVDALGEKNGKKALDELHVLMEGEDGLSVLPMIVRQFRLLLLTREIMDQGGSPERIAQDLRSKCFNVNPWMAAKLYRQAGHFSLRALEDIYRRLLALEETLKSTPIDASVAMDTLVAELTG